VLSTIILNVLSSMLTGVVLATRFEQILALIRNIASFFLAGFSGFLPSSSDILQAELTTIFLGLSMAKKMGIVELVCYSDSLLSINLIIGNTSRFHVYAVLIQEIKVLLSQANYALYHTLREGNQCANSLAKWGTTSDVGFNLHQSPWWLASFCWGMMLLELSSWDLSLSCFCFSCFLFSLPLTMYELPDVRSPWI